MPLYVVTWQDVLDVYCRAMQVPDAVPYIRNAGLIRSAIARPYHTFGGVSAYPTLHEKAAALLSGVAKAHGFIDGNKRAAVLLSVVFVRASGYHIPSLSLNKLDDIVVDLVTGDRSEASVAMWFHLVIE